LKRSKIKISVIGLWHQGIVTAACLSEAGYNVIGIDSDSKIIKNLNSTITPVFEPGLDLILAKQIKKKRLTFRNNFSLIKNADLIILAHDTQIKNNDEIKLKKVHDDIQNIIPHLRPKQVLHVTSQVPVGTCNFISNVINKKIKFFNNIAYTPENLRLGQAIYRYKNPSLPIIGVSNNYTFNYLKKIYKIFSDDWKKTDLKTAEITKHGLNTFLAMSITYANEIGNLCDKLGIDGHEVGKLLKIEPRIGRFAMLRPGMGFAGGTLARDVKTLINLSKNLSIKTPLINSIMISNVMQNNLPIKILKKIFKNKLQGKRVLVLGLTYKSNTSTLRRSVSLQIIKKLISNKVKVSSYDPMASRFEIAKHKFLNFHENIFEAVKNIDAIIVSTPWNNFLNLDLKKIKNLMKNNIFVDICDLFNGSEVIKKGFDFYSIGNNSSFRKII
jgi:UDPglucose 6-dehydrogenase